MLPLLVSSKFTLLAAGLWFVHYCCPIIGIVLVGWLVHTIWKYRHIPPRH